VVVELPKKKRAVKIRFFDLVLWCRSLSGIVSPQFPHKKFPPLPVQRQSVNDNFVLKKRWILSLKSVEKTFSLVDSTLCLSRRTTSVPRSDLSRTYASVSHVFSLKSVLITQ
jgi:hypothetical protein